MNGTPAHATQPHRCAAFRLCCWTNARANARATRALRDAKGEAVSELRRTCLRLRVRRGVRAAVLKPRAKPTLARAASAGIRRAGALQRQKMRASSCAGWGFGVWQDSQLWCEGRQRDVPAVLGSEGRFAKAVD